MKMKKNFFFAALASVLVLSSCGGKRDYALSDSKNEWSHHFSYGSPSWDSFEHLPDNPVYAGHEGMEWPVNGFLFSDPVSKNWYLFIGEYRQNYSFLKNSTTQNCNCVIKKSADKGKTWEIVGNLFPPNMPAYDSLNIQVPDVMVVYEEGKYHMIFDYISVNTSWQELDETGLGYAVADKPEGPYVVSAKPLKVNTEYRQKPLLERYWRMYAPMIVRRKNDWVILYMMDRSPSRSWALAASTSQKPEGPYSDPLLLRNVESKTNYPPLMEYFPAFSHSGYLYFPATSVAVNRNYQMIFRVKPEEVMDQKKWEIFSAGSVWHSKNSDNEYAGIWGQTITGFVDETDSIRVMFPSKNKINYGTINLAKASWNNLFRKRGFSLSSCEGGSFTYIKRAIDLNSLNMDFSLEGTMKVVWDFHKTLDIENMWGKFSFEQKEGDLKEIEVNRNYWKVKINNSNHIETLDSGSVRNWNVSLNNLQLRKENGSYSLYINDQKCWNGELSNDPGVVGIILDPHSNLFVNRFDVSGSQTRGKLVLGYYEALLNSGNIDEDWDFIKDSSFINGQGAISKKDTAFAKWNFEGTGFEIYLPKGPLFGSVAVYVDDQLRGNILLKNDITLSSSIVFKSSLLSRGAHSVYVESVNGRLPLDCIEVSF
jgi:hypothetical protein